MGLVIGALAIAIGCVGLKYSIAAIVAGVTAIMAFFSTKRG